MTTETVIDRPLAKAARPRPPGAPNPSPGRAGPFTRHQLSEMEFKAVEDNAETVDVILTDLHIDTGYQYHPETEPGRIHQLLTWLASRGGWDAKMAGPILLNRRKDGSLWVVDGGGRRWMAMRAGEVFIKAIIFDGLTWTEEAALFRFKNQNARIIRAPHLFMTGAVEGVEPNKTIVPLVAEAGYAIERTTANKKSALIAPGALIFAHAVMGPEKLRAALFDLRNTWGDTINGPALGSLAPLYAAYGNRLTEGDRLRKVMRKTKYDLLVNSARAKAAEHVTTRNPQSRDYTPFMTGIMIDSFNENVPRPRRLHRSKITSLREMMGDEAQYRDVWSWVQWTNV